MSPMKPGAGRPDRSDRRYWRSIERLLDSPAVAATPEFPEGADLPPDAVDRRTVLGLMGASFGLAGLQGCRRPIEHIVPFVEPPERMIPGIPRRYASTFQRAGEALGVVVESHDGRPTKVEGNDLHPASGGAASLWMQAEVLALYDPDRLREPRRRSEETGDLEAADWAAFEAWWSERVAAHADGGGLAVLAGPSASPTREDLRRLFLERFPGAQWASWSPVDESTVVAGVAAACGRALVPVPDFAAARVVLALDADVLMDEPGAVRNARGFAAGRRADGEMNRLYVAESTMTTTGSMADHRVRIQSRRIPAFTAAVARALGVAAPAAELAPDLEAKAARIAEDLRSAGAAGLVVAGGNQPAIVHELVARANAALGAVGTTVSFHEPVGPPDAGATEIVALADALRAGEVSTLVVLGGNPVYDAPADVGLAEAIAGVEAVVRLGPSIDETAATAHWVLPESHSLEAWGDARDRAGTASLVQPLIAPLFDSRSELEVLGLMADGQSTSGYERVRAAWTARLGATWSEDLWRRTLHDGVLAAGSDVEGEPGTDDVGAVSIATDTVTSELPSFGSEGLEISFRPCRKIHDGRCANNGWLQELPDPITKVTWNNAALVSPATARELGIAAGDRVSLTLDGRTVEAPVFVLPGQADGSVAVALGYGRTAAGRVGTGVGFDAYLMRRSAALGFDAGVQVAKTGSAPVVQTQEHWSMEGRDLVREATLEEYRANPNFVGPLPDPEKSHQLFPSHDYSEGPQWGMTIDLSSCTGCNACVVACQAENNIPIVGPDQVDRGREMHWLRIDRYFAGELDDPEVVFQPIPCMHCENAPCEQVCPVAATTHDDEGLNAMVYNRCIGTRYCSNNCPYKVRRFNFYNFTKDTPELVKMAMNPDVTVRSRGVMEKCTYCLQRISEGKIAAKRERRELRDGDVVTACQETCPSGAITFGDIRDPDSAVSAAKADPRNYHLLGDLNNRPRTTYLGRVRNPNPAWEA